MVNGWMLLVQEVSDRALWCARLVSGRLFSFFFFLIIKMPTDVQQSGQSHVSRHFKWMERSRCKHHRGSERRQPAPSNTSSSLSNFSRLLILDGRKMKNRREKKVYRICIWNFIFTCVGCEILSRVNNQLDEDVTALTAGSDTVTFGRDEWREMSSLDLE